MGNRVLSPSSILRAILKIVKCMKHVPYHHCQCSKCLNGGLLLSAVKAANVKGLMGSMMQAALLSMCPPEGNITNMMIGDCRCECIFRECKKCGASKLEQYLLDQNPDMKWDKTVQWHQWEEV